MSSPKIYLAPLKGLTDHVFRNTYAAHFSGIDVAVAPFISSKQDNKFKRKYVKDVLPENNSLMPVIPQILSKSANDFICLANFLYDFGYVSVNWNLGCPFPMVAGKGRGAGMLPNTDKIHEFLDRVIHGMNGKLSIKLRLGWESPGDIFRLIPVLNQYPLDEVIIHPRTGIQRYEGGVDHDAFRQCLLLIRHRVIYNGDIKTPEVFNEFYSSYEDVSGWMVGRWCIINPFLPEMILGRMTHPLDKTTRMKQFHAALFENYRAVLDGPSHLLNKMKGFWQYFSISFKQNKKALKRIKKSQYPEEYLSHVNDYFDNEAEWFCL